MNNKKYNPSVSTKKQREIVERAYYFALSFRKPRQCTALRLKERFGDRTRPMHIWAMDNLLTCTNGFYSKRDGIAKEYVRNDICIAYLSDLLEGNTTQLYAEYMEKFDTKNIKKYYLPAAFLEKEFGKELRYQKLKYEKIGHRYYNELQSVDKEIRNPFLARNGFIHDYDIECCNITLLLQYAEKCYKELIDNKDSSMIDKVSFSGLYEYKADRKAAREYLASKFEISTDDAKEIFTALLNGSNLSYFDGKLVKKFGQNLCKRIKVDPFIRRFNRGVASIWRVITRHGILTAKDTRGWRAITRGGRVEMVRKRFDARQKAEFYFMLEGVVVDLYRKWLKDQKIKFFMIHDGFVTNRLVDTYELAKFIKKESGFDVNFEHKILE